MMEKLARRLLLIAIPVLMALLPASAQLKSYIIGVKGDTLNRVDQKSRKQGPWVERREAVRSEPGYEEEGEYKDDLKTGLWRRYSLQGDILAVEEYKWGMKHGKQVYFNLEGRPTREESWRAVDPKSPYDTVPVFDVNDPSKIVKYTIVKVEPVSRKHGIWKFYDARSGKLDGTEEWVNDKLRDEADQAVAAAAPASDANVIGVVDATAAPGTKKPPVKKDPPKLKEVAEWEKKHQKKHNVRTGETGG